MVFTFRVFFMCPHITSVNPGMPACTIEILPNKSSQIVVWSLDCSQYQWLFLRWRWIVRAYQTIPQTIPHLELEKKNVKRLLKNDCLFVCLFKRRSPYGFTNSKYHIPHLLSVQNDSCWSTKSVFVTVMARYIVTLKAYKAIRKIITKSFQSHPGCRSDSLAASLMRLVWFAIFK